VEKGEEIKVFLVLSRVLTSGCKSKLWTRKKRRIERLNSRNVVFSFARNKGREEKKKKGISLWHTQLPLAPGWVYFKKEGNNCLSEKGEQVEGTDKSDSSRITVVSGNQDFKPVENRGEAKKSQVIKNVGSFEGDEGPDQGSGGEKRGKKKVQKEREQN